MGNMVLGSYTFADNPSDLPIIQEALAIAYQQTYAGVATFVYDAIYAGQELPLTWEFMTTGQYETHLTQYATGDSLVWDPQDDKGKTFNVTILSLEGEYHLYLENSTGNYRKNVKMKLLILSEVA